MLFWCLLVGAFSHFLVVNRVLPSASTASPLPSQATKPLLCAFWILQFPPLPQYVPFDIWWRSHCPNHFPYLLVWPSCTESLDPSAASSVAALKYCKRLVQLCSSSFLLLFQALTSPCICPALNVCVSDLPIHPNHPGAYILSLSTSHRGLSSFSIQILTQGSDLSSGKLITD